MLVPTLCVGTHPVTLRVTTAQDLNLALPTGRRASGAAFPRRAWERSSYIQFRRELMWEPGLPAMQAPRSVSQTQAMPSGD
jgi:hypothetical protein